MCQYHLHVLCYLRLVNTGIVRAVSILLGKRYARHLTKTGRMQIQNEERATVREKAALTVREKRAEWLGAPLNPEAALDVLDLLGPASAAATRGSIATASALNSHRDSSTARFNQRALDALITPRGANIPRLAQAGKNPRQWLGRIQPGALTARERRLHLLNTSESRELGLTLSQGQENFFLTGSHSVESVCSKGASVCLVCLRVCLLILDRVMERCGSLSASALLWWS